MNKIILFVLLLQSVAFAENQDLCMFQNKKGIVLLSKNPEYVWLSYPHPAWSWEGKATKGYLEKTPYGVDMSWNIDIIGPEWLNIHFSQLRYGVFVSIDNSGSGFVNCHWYNNYDSLANSKDECASYVKAMLSRIGQNPILPHIEMLKVIILNKITKPDKDTESECLSLIMQLDDDNWKIRDAARNKLEDERLFSCALYLKKTLNLSLEQENSYDVINAKYKVNVPESLSGQFMAFIKD